MNMGKIRESNYDLLRSISTLAVVMLHISSSFFWYNEFLIPENCHLPIMFLNHIVRFAVPCFFMLSGAFLLDDERNADHKYFYKKSIKNIGITGIIFCLIYFIYSIVRLMAGVFIFKKHTPDYIFHTVLDIIKSFVKGEPFYHLWYLFALIGLYFLVPFIIRISSNLQSGG